MSGGCRFFVVYPLVRYAYRPGGLWLCRTCFAGVYIIGERHFIPQMKGIIFMRDTDAKLLAAAKLERAEGQSNAFEQILLRYEKLIHHIARRYFTNREDVLDAGQDAVIRIYKGLANVVIEEDGNLKAWICTVTANTCLDIVRKRRITTEELTDDRISASPTLPSAEESAVTNERVREILAAIAKLPDDHRMVLILRDMQGLSYEELAEALGLTLGTVKSRLSRARMALKRLLD